MFIGWYGAAKTKDATNVAFVASLASLAVKLPLIKLVAEHFFLGGLWLSLRRRRSNRAQWNESTFRLRLFQDVLPIELFHARVFCALFEFFIAGPQLLFTRGLGNTQLVERSVASRMN